MKSENNCADGLSRNPIPESNPETNPTDKYTYLHFIAKSEIAHLGHKNVANETSRDARLSKVVQVVRDGWPNNGTLNSEIKSFSTRKDERTIEKGYLMWGYRIVIPKKLRSAALRELHSTHLGVAEMKSIAQSYVCRPGLDQEIENIAKSCRICLIERDQPPKPPLDTWRWPDRPWHRIHTDYNTEPFMNKYFLLIIDSYAKRPEMQ